MASERTNRFKVHGRHKYPIQPYFSENLQAEVYILISRPHRSCEPSSSTLLALPYFLPLTRPKVQIKEVATDKN